MTDRRFAQLMNNLSSQQIAKAMESLPTDALEWGVRFEALAHTEPAARHPLSQPETTPDVS